MPDVRLGYVAIIRTTGDRVLVRADSITHVFHNQQPKKDGEKGEMIPVLTLHCGPQVVIHTAMSEKALLSAIGNASALGNIVVVDPVEPE